MEIRAIIRNILLNEISEDVKIEPILSQDIPEVLNVCAEVFSNVMSKNAVKDYIKSVANWNISIKATLNDKIIGCYIFNEDSVLGFNSCSNEDLEKYRHLKGIQGVGLAVLPEYRGTGIGKKMREYPLHMNYDYIWGQHLHGLHNIDNWIKFGRRVVGDCNGLFITLMDLKNNG